MQIQQKLTAMVGEAGIEPTTPGLEGPTGSNSPPCRHFLYLLSANVYEGFSMLALPLLLLSTVGTPPNFHHTPHNFPHSFSGDFRPKFAKEINVFQLMLDLLERQSGKNAAKGNPDSRKRRHTLHEAASSGPE